MQRGIGGWGMKWFAGGDLLCVAAADAIAAVAVAGCINVWDQQKAEQKPIKLPVTVQRVRCGAEAEVGVGGTMERKERQRERGNHHHWHKKRNVACCN